MACSVTCRHSVQQAWAALRRCVPCTHRAAAAVAPRSALCGTLVLCHVTSQHIVQQLQSRLRPSLLAVVCTHSCGTLVCCLSICLPAVNLPGFSYSVDSRGNPSVLRCPVNTYGPGLKKQRACVPCPTGFSSNGKDGQSSSAACGKRLQVPATVQHRTQSAAGLSLPKPTSNCHAISCDMALGECSSIHCESTASLHTAIDLMCPLTVPLVSCSVACWVLLKGSGSCSPMPARRVQGWNWP